MVSYVANYQIHLLGKRQNKKGKICSTSPSPKYSVILRNFSSVNPFLPAFTEKTKVFICKVFCLKSKNCLNKTKFNVDFILYELECILELIYMFASENYH